MRIELADCTNTLLREIAEPKVKRRSVAMTYALALNSREKTDWQRVNAAIISRWSRSGLEWIKKQVWRSTMTDEQPSAAAFQHWDKVREQDWKRPFAPSDWAYAIMKAFDAGAAAERARNCGWKRPETKGSWSGHYPTGCGQHVHVGEIRSFCPYCGGKIVVAR